MRTKQTFERCDAMKETKVDLYCGCCHTRLRKAPKTGANVFECSRGNRYLIIQTTVKSQTGGDISTGFEMEKITRLIAPKRKKG